MNTVSVRCVSRMLTPNCPQVSEELLKRYRRDPAKIYFTTHYSGWNVDAQLRFWVRTTKHAIERTNHCHFITLYNSVLFHVECKQPTTIKMHKIFIAQKSYCACHVLSLATIRSKYSILILFWTELGQAENFLIAPRTSMEGNWKLWSFHINKTTAIVGGFSSQQAGDGNRNNGLQLVEPATASDDQRRSNHSDCQTGTLRPFSIEGITSLDLIWAKSVQKRRHQIIGAELEIVYLRLLWSEPFRCSMRNGSSEVLVLNDAACIAAAERVSVERHGVLTSDRVVILVTGLLHLRLHDDRTSQLRTRLVNPRHTVPTGRRVSRQPIAYNKRHIVN